METDSLEEGQFYNICGSWFGLKGGRVIAASVLLAGWVGGWDIPTEVALCPTLPWEALRVGCRLPGPRVSPSLISERGKRNTPGRWLWRNYLVLSLPYWDQQGCQVGLHRLCRGPGGASHTAADLKRLVAEGGRPF